MNLTQFAQLKIGDKIELPATGAVGEVVATPSKGVTVSWHAGTAPFTYTMQSTAWFQWELVRHCPLGGRCTLDYCRQNDQCASDEAAKVQSV